MWQFPAVESSADGAAGLTQYLRENFKIAVNGNLKQLNSARHTVTFREIRLLPFLIQVPRLPIVVGARAAKLANFGSLPVSNATRKVAAIALASVSSPSGR
jgi:hypothetical protein